MQSKESAEAPSMLVNEIRKLEQRQKQLGDEANRALEVVHEEVALHQLGNKETAETIAKLLSETKEIQDVRFISEESVTGDGANLKDEISRWQTQADDIKSLERKLENVQKSIDQLVITFQIVRKILSSILVVQHGTFRR
ncbi:hypothetical protein C1H46_020666 [Malus baccata]|uniref:Uncharacterized protein n=1 Tax=Malus baccata TaxID=106549 RepID=A0A540M577_MALBA|nr:hypothetical protein C1H46_020666 [Malus baccata]